MTADTDFVPIIKEIMKNKELTLIYFTDKKRKSAFSLSNHLWKAVDDRILIKREFFSILEYNIAQGKCAFCNAAIPGIFLGDGSP